MLQPHAEIFQLFIPLTSLQSLHNNKVENRISEVFANVFKRKNWSFTLTSVFRAFPCAWLKHLWQRLQHQVFFLGLTRQASNIAADPLRLCQAGWGLSFQPFHIHVSPEMFDWVQVRALSGPLKDIHRVVPKPLLLCLCCLFRVIVLLEGEPQAVSEALGALHEVFVKDISVLCSVQPSLNPDQSLSPSSAGFPPDVTLRIEAKQFSLGFYRTRVSCFSQSECPLRALSWTPDGLSCVNHWREASVWPP